jgi:hypothetical protein
VIKHLADPGLRSSMDDELVYQTFLNTSPEMAAWREARGS